MIRNAGLQRLQTFDGRILAEDSDVLIVGSGVSGALIAWGLAEMGYVANQAQDDASRLGIVLLLTVVPGVVALLAALVMRAYPLDATTLAQVQVELDARRGAVP